jgi:hypothetical protein
MPFIAFVAVWLEVSLVLLTFDEILFVILYDLSHSELQSQCFGFSTALFTFAADLPRWWPVLSKFLDLVFQKLDLRSSDGLCLPRVSPPHSSAFQLPDATCRVFVRLSLVGLRGSQALNCGSDVSGLGLWFSSALPIDEVAIF